PTYQELLKLSPSAVSILVAIPVIVGSLGRVPLGALTDRLGGRLVFSVATLACIVPVIWLGFAAGYIALLAGALLLGIGGATFAVGVPFVNSWFPPSQRGLALGIFGAGNIGTAVSGFVTPWLSDTYGRSMPFWVVAVALAVIGVLFLLLGRDAPDRKPASTPFLRRFADALALRSTKELSALYAITFGGFVAFGVYLPLYLKSAYALSTSDAALRAAGFVVLATLLRPVGGALADRMPGVRLLRGVFAVIAVCAIVVSFTPAMPLATIAFLIMAAALGMGNGVVFALVAERVPESMVGSATGVVGAAGGLGGFLPPIVMGLIYSFTGSYSIGYMLLSDVALAAFVY
ncbi:MAG: MFS transporter, partial [Stackebrandtia sp.]